MKYTLKELRARKEWTQQFLADRLGVSVQTYNSWERDFGIIRISYANKLVNLFEVTLDDVFFTPEHEYISCDENLP